MASVEQRFFLGELDEAGVGWLTLGRGRRITGANRNLLAWLGCAAVSELVGRRVNDLAAPELARHHDALVRRCARRGVLQGEEIVYVCRNEDRLPLVMDGIVSGEGARVEILLVYRREGMLGDAGSAIPRRGGAGQHPLREERYRLALQASNEGIWDWNIVTGEIYYSDRILQWFGCDRLTAPNVFARPEEHVDPEDLAEFRSSLERYLLRPCGDEPLAIECRLRVCGGEPGWFRVRGLAVRERSGRAVRMAGSLMNITARKRAEEALEEERHLLRTLIDSVPVNIYFKDLESRFTLVNRSLARWFGYREPHELIGKTDAEIFAPEHAEKALADEREIIRTARPLVGDLERETWSEREDTWVLTTKMPLRDRRGRVRGTFGVSSDVTAMVRAQRALEQMTGELREKNRLMEEEFKLAREIQQALLPRAHPIFPPGVEPGESAIRFAHRYLPISALAGDFFQVFAVSDSAAGVIVCDVMGHGVRSALVAAVLSGLVEEERGAAGDPGAFLGRINRGLLRILRQAEAAVFVTAYYVVIDLEAGVLRHANAGHPRPVLVSRSARGAERLPDAPDGRGPALGILSDAVYPSGSRDLAGIDLVVLFTDGIYEIGGSGGQSCPQDLFLGFFRENIGRPAPELLDGVIDGARRHAQGGQFEDDVCLVSAEIVR